MKLKPIITMKVEMIEKPKKGDDKNETKKTKPNKTD